MTDRQTERQAARKREKCASNTQFWRSAEKLWQLFGGLTQEYGVDKGRTTKKRQIISEKRRIAIENQT